MPKSQRPKQLPNENERDFSHRTMEWKKATRRVVRPEPKKFHRNDHDKGSRRRVDLIKEFSKSGLQIIVKLADIHLTPNSPEYNGGTWHVEGQMVIICLALEIRVLILKGLYRMSTFARRHFTITMSPTSPRAVSPFANNIPAMKV